MSAWILPPNVADVLPLKARVINRLRDDSLAIFQSYGYELIQPPLIEYASSLEDSMGEDLRAQTFSLSGDLEQTGMPSRLVLRADMTPQAARIDAHTLNRSGVARLCYAGPILRQHTSVLQGAVESIQIGAELFGDPSMDADSEIVELIGTLLERFMLPNWCFDFCHVGIFKALLEDDPKAAQKHSEILKALQQKNIPAIRELNVKPYWQELIKLHGGGETLSRARQKLPSLSAIDTALEQLEYAARVLPQENVHFDLADLRGFSYHKGLMFSVYAVGQALPLIAGGRYDNIGERFGRHNRPATGFSLDLLKISELLPLPEVASAIFIPRHKNLSTKQKHSLHDTVARLRAVGEIVICDKNVPTASTYTANRTLEWHDEQWKIITLA